MVNETPPAHEHVMPDGNAIWEDLRTHPRVADQFSLLTVPVVVFQDAVFAYNARAYVGTSLICRAVLEAAFYVFLTSTKAGDQPGVWRIDFPLKLDGSYRRIPWPELAAAIKKRKVLSASQLADVERIRERGNLVAHLGSKHHEAIIAAMENVKKEIWVLPWEAGEDLRDTADILKRLSDAAVADPSGAKGGESVGVL